MDGEAARLALGPHGDFIGVMNKENPFIFKLGTFCKPVFQMKISEKSPTDVGYATGERNLSSRNTTDFY